MSSKRGRKRNDNLPPNRARDVQRAFRARRAAHLLALEERVSELEEENAKLRRMIGWAPDTRPPLGRGPTGKDRPKIGTSSGDGSYAIEFFSSHGSESDSPSRTSSLSPSAIASRAGMHVIDSDTWENTLTINEADDQPPESPYPVPPATAPASTKPLYPSYASGLSSSLPSSSSREPIASSSTSYASSQADTYSHSERNFGAPQAYSNSGFVGRSDEMPIDSPRLHFSYQTQHYQNHDSDIHPQSQTSTPPPLSTTSPPPHSHSHGSAHHHQQRNVPTTFTHRRAYTEHYPITRDLQLPIPALMQVPQGPRSIDQQHRLHDGAHQQHHQSQHQQQDSNQSPYRMASYSQMP
ncbi:hypothetical protein H0H92_009446 [Tricholoma furcatifolium]|nr:hypothetical protein H0H92_009446 [Tricholoma furcatifolium]